MLLAGCGRSPTDPNKTELTFWTISLSPSYDQYIHGLMAEYEAQNPHVKLNWVDLPQSASRQKLMAGIAAGAPPDLVNTSTDFALILAQYGAITELSEHLTQEQIERYFPNLWSATEYENGVYAFPWYVTTKVIMYNKQILANAGLDPDSPPGTLEELDRQARQISKNTEAVGLMPDIRIWNDWAMEGAPAVDFSSLTPLFTDPEAVAVLERYHQLYQDGVMPPETLTEGYRGALDRYKAGSLAFLEAGPQFLLRIKADAPSIYQVTGIAPMPRTRTNTLPAATMNFVIPRSSKHREEAVKLGLFLTSPPAQLEFCKLVPILPSTIESAEDPFFQSGGEDELQSEAVRISLSQLPRARDFNLGLPRQKDLMRSLQNAVEQAVRGEKPTAQALSEASEDWEKTLAPFRSTIE
ncbi:MAG: sugar ABC transporter substrate-binding protein [Vulcanimicrobiota bacterium]